MCFPYVFESGDLLLLRVDHLPAQNHLEQPRRVSTQLVGQRGRWVGQCGDRRVELRERQAHTAKPEDS